tara:strand:+ start:375 stop:497 length:123 start_codon:yes stop_codon:yes gene_type:complete
MIKKLFRKYLIYILLSDEEIRRLLKQIVLTNIGDNNDLDM